MTTPLRPELLTLLNNPPPQWRDNKFSQQVLWRIRRRKLVRLGILSIAWIIGLTACLFAIQDFVTAELVTSSLRLWSNYLFAAAFTTVLTLLSLGLAFLFVLRRS